MGSGKTIVSLISAQNVINNKQQVAFMSPTEILAKQHFNLFKKFFKDKGNIEYANWKNRLQDKEKISKSIR